MFAFWTTLSKSWVTTRARALWWYYTGRFHLRRSDQSVCIHVQPPGKQQYSLNWETPEDARNSLRFFSPDNPWLHFNLPSDIKTVIDLGANIGISSLYWSMQYPMAQIYAVEMVASNAERCRKLLEQNHAKAEVIQAAVAASDGVLEYQANPNHTRSHLQVFQDIPTDQAKLVSVQTYSMASLLRKLSLQHVDLLKVDIEGSEIYLLESIESWAPAVRFMLMELHHNIVFDDAVRRVKQAGFEIVGEDHAQRTEIFCRRVDAAAVTRSA